MSLFQDSDLNVRRVALVAFNSAAHNKPSLIRDLLKTILPQLYNETKVIFPFLIDRQLLSLLFRKRNLIF